ncbi:LOW QUALITY PROTEIN: hypothetical protein KUF71_023885 [Frankliniella fusca]|uniref:Integrase catalytic domain-containing protein n=1 Tax=Frankliniella fusca TaxID=407009 RepID=A0AAE1H4M7_9NEOP|nr:LOW QUALITY PROTEIN: hypothetical protein KUF71_023885 [Frankliniella fusca]
MFDGVGMSVDPDRVESLVNLKPPENVEAYVPQMADLMHSLQQLLRKNVEFQWLPAHDKAFEVIKQAICKSPVLTPFDPKRTTINCLSVTSQDKQMLEVVHSISAHLPMSSKRKQDFVTETSSDRILSKVIKYSNSSWPSQNKLSPECNDYYELRDDLYVQDGLLFLHDCSKVPTVLCIRVCSSWASCLPKALAKSKQLFYLPTLSHDVSESLMKCRTCEKYRSNNSKELLLPLEVPTLRYEKVEFTLSIKKNSAAVIDGFQNVFTRYGYPKQILADNNPFPSHECKKYAEYGIELVACSPEHHKSDGLAEGAVKIVKQLMRKSEEDKRDYSEAVMEQNNTTISNLPMSSSQILHSRMLRTPLVMHSKWLEPHVQVDVVPLLKIKQTAMKKAHDKRVKRYTVNYKPDDEVIARTLKYSYWRKAKVVKFAKEPRSHWLQVKVVYVMSMYQCPCSLNVIETTPPVQSLLTKKKKVKKNPTVISKPKKSRFGRKLTSPKRLNL